jgi:signal transduction histidine kinase/ActR/RegA family two-component response regulator
MAIWRRLLDEQLDLVAAESRRTLVARLIVATVIAMLVGLNSSLTIGAIWLSCVLLEEAWFWTASVAPAAGRPNSILQRLSYTGTMLTGALIWSSAALVYWSSAQEGVKIAALGVLAGQMVHAQCFAFRSRLALMILGGIPAALLLGLTILGGDFQGLPLVTLGVTATMLVVYVFTSATVNLKAAQALEAAQREAVDANHAKSAFLAMMSHELRTPMNGVLGMAHALKGARLDVRQAGQVDALIRSGGELMTILNDLLDVAKIEAGRLELETTAFDVIELGDRVHEMWRDLAAAKGVRLVYDVASGTPRWLTGDPNRLRQVMLNLVSNALKFTEAGEVRLALRALPDISGAPNTARIEIAVADTGLGISADQKARLFEAFAQAEAATARKFGGTGLGLSICKQLVDLMGGEITVDSQPGRGSIFRVVLELPLAQAPEENPEQTEDGGVAGLNILVAEDNVLNQAVARAILEAMGCRLEVANDGVEALEMLRRGGFDIVLMDINMPRMGGVEALSRIRAGEAGEANLPVIALTADAMPGEDDKLLALGFDDVQPKPIQPMALITAISQACAQARGGDSVAA